MSQECSQRVTHQDKIEWPSYKHYGSAGEKYMHIDIFNSETEHKSMTEIAVHDMVDASGDLLGVLHNRCREL